MEQQQQQGDLPGTKASRSGRANRDGTEETIKIKPIKDACADLMKLHKKAENAKADYRTAVKGVAERSGTNAANINKLVKASSKGNYSDVRRDIDQQSVIFEQVGEIAGGKGADA